MPTTFRDTLFRVTALIRKELLAVLKDPASRVILIMPAIFQSLIFGYVATFDLNHVPYALLDESRSVTSAALVARLDGTGVFQRVADLPSARSIPEIVDSGKALMVLHIGADFERRVLGGDNAPVQVILDGRNSTTAGAAAGYVGAVAADFNASLAGSAGNTTQPTIAIETRAWFNPNLETRWNFMPSLIATLSVLQTLLLTALSVAREREQGTFDQLLVTPLSPTEIMVGKAVPPILIGMVQSTLVLLVTRFWFGVPMAGSLWALYAALLMFMTAGVGIGLSISAVAASMQQAMLYTFVLLMPMMLLSGLTTPIANMPEVLQLATYANPLRFGIDMVRRIYLEGVGLGVVLPDFVPLVAITAITMPIAGWLFRHRLV
ncbi:MAG TPA: ABC transporter permease [Caldimonas sp.]|jgi:ABC-2 type transport system permease protein|nr:ABC transporter permease [Caldimonas sp.]HEX4234787.1 ABC transporter permease [Caldimonas sp.]